MEFTQSGNAALTQPHSAERRGDCPIGAMAPNPIFIQTEDGLANLDCARFPLAGSFGDVMAAITSLYSDLHEYRTIAIDRLDWLERMI